MSSLRVLYLSQYFPPEIGATQTRAMEMARGLVKAGHQVTVLTEFPNHPSGIIPPSYRRKLYAREKLGDVSVIRVWVKASPNKTFRNRIAFYLSFMFMAILAGLFLARGKYDAIYASSPPLFVGGAALVISLLRRTPMFFEVRDLWPESALALGEVKKGASYKIATWLEEACYKRATGIVVVTQGIADRLLERRIPAGKITLIPNGANINLYQPRPPDRNLKESLGLKAGQFVIVYTGLLGLVHDIETILEAAALLADRPDIRFLIVGDGPRKQALRQLASEMKLDNVIWQEAVAEESLPDYICLSDVGIHAQRTLGISHMALPVKMFSYMACERPVILAIEGEAEALLVKSEAGIVVPPEDPKALVDAILQLKIDPERRAVYGDNGRSTVEKEFSRQALSARLAILLEEKTS